MRLRRARELISTDHGRDRSLSRSDLKILHVDGNSYYGGEDAALSLDEAAKWADSTLPVEFGKACLTVTGNEHSSIEHLDRSQLAPSRSYTLALNPQIIYAKSRTLPALVSSQIHTQLEFQAVGATYVLKDGQLQKIPSNREDVFADQTLTMRDKRKLMGLLRYVLNEQEEEHEDVVLSDKLRNDFKLSGALESAVLALALLSTTAADTKFNYTAARLRRHLHSMGYFGPGLAAVMAKYGGNSEIAQVGCRACAVGGGVYLLGHQVVDIQPSPDEGFSQVTLSNGVTVRARYVVASTRDLTFQTLNKISIQPPQTQSIVRSVTIISHPLKRLFVPVSESATIPAVVAVMVDGGQTDLPPVYLQVHSEDTAECPKNQCKLSPLSSNTCSMMINHNLNTYLHWLNASACC